MVLWEWSRRVFPPEVDGRYWLTLQTTLFIGYAIAGVIGFDSGRN